MRRSPPSVCDTAPVRFNAFAWRPFGSWFLKAESFGSLGKVLKKGTEKTLPCRLPVGSGTLAFPTAVYPYTLGGWALCHCVCAHIDQLRGGTRAVATRGRGEVTGAFLGELKDWHLGRPFPHIDHNIGLDVVVGSTAAGVLVCGGRSLIRGCGSLVGRCGILVRGRRIASVDSRRARINRAKSI